MHPLRIGHLTVSEVSPPLVIAEVGINHDGDPEQAKEMITVAAACGADLVKLQSFQPEKFLAPDLPYYAAIEKLAFSFPQQEELFRHAADAGILLFSAPFDNETADFLDTLGAPAFKIASMDCTNVPLLRHVARKGKPIFLATGMAEEKEIEWAVATVRKEGNDRIILMHCVSDYPAARESMDLNSIPMLAKRFGLPVGLSDHSLGLRASFAAAAIGAAAIERHFTLDRGRVEQFPYSDHAISIEPTELKELTSYCKILPAMRGAGRRELTANERENRNNSRRGIYAARDLAQGETLKEEDCIPLRPVRGAGAEQWDLVIGKKLNRSVGKLEPIELSFIENA